MEINRIYQVLRKTSENKLDRKHFLLFKKARWLLIAIYCYLYFSYVIDQI